MGLFSIDTNFHKPSLEWLLKRYRKEFREIDNLNKFYSVTLRSNLPDIVKQENSRLFDKKISRAMERKDQYKRLIEMLYNIEPTIQIAKPNF